MIETKHWNIKVPNGAGKENLITDLTQGKVLLQGIPKDQIKLYSVITLAKFIREEEIHDKFEVLNERGQALKSMSSGERKRALLDYFLAQETQVLILDNPLDSLDVEGREMLIQRIEEVAQSCQVINIVSRERDFLPFVSEHLVYQEGVLKPFESSHSAAGRSLLQGSIPEAIETIEVKGEELIRMNQVSVSYLERAILKDISWTIRKGEFWQLKGPNGAGKTTLLSMITGDNHKAYGQDITLFGFKKGSGESVWDIKKNIGYYTSNMTYDFWRNQSVEYMIISGYFDSVGLYQKPSELMRKRTEAWLDLIGLSGQKDKPFIDLPIGHRRLVLIARAMVKHPPLLILDEPASDLDDHNAQLMSDLVNKIARESETAILYVSHQDEEGLRPEKVYELKPGQMGSTGHVVK
ncbi:ATP-binding cassette domain-containing protein [Reichenbachiella ulvae]|uniref:ATP-binding cassette domain-containing protein n=1 Tax=Reichenbachiella ulvae TaxID=2980104 RepID=A0ABT3CSC9_9BACT|nr:ATP-binding cassette domain-containing protein [Reichenbachiella ulvae]MCV9386468.1 ATP-binding cassette domain-containing protein [Reichenbachiella ulvae]